MAANVYQVGDPPRHCLQRAITFETTSNLPVPTHGCGGFSKATEGSAGANRFVMRSLRLPPILRMEHKVRPFSETEQIINPVSNDIASGEY